MLDSQSPRSSNRRDHMYRNKPARTGRIAIGLVLVAAVVLAVWWLMPDDETTPIARVGGSESGDTSGEALDTEAPPSGEGLLPAMTTTVADDHGESTDGDEADAAAKPQIANDDNLPDLSMAPGARNTVDPGPRTPTEDPAPAAKTEPEPAASQNTTARARQLYSHGMDLLGPKPLEARTFLTRAIASGGLAAEEATRARMKLGELNQRLVFSPEIMTRDPFSFAQLVQSGDSLARIAKRLSLQVDWRFIQRINRIADARHIRQGDRIKIITGPFHALIDKSDYRFDLYMGDDEEQVFVRSFVVGLGQYNSTPTGLFRVRPNSKLINPEWINPRTRERYDADDPLNPIGERWIGLEGIEEATSMLAGYGIHGTVDQESIGTQASMGCVRMSDEDVALVYEVLTEGVSVVKIVD